MIEQEDARLKRTGEAQIEDCDALAVGNLYNQENGRNRRNFDEDPISARPMNVRELAIDNIYFECAGHEWIEGPEFAFPKDGIQILYEKLKNSYGDIHARIFLFFLQNDQMIDEDGKVSPGYEHLLTYFNRLITKIKDGVEEHGPYRVRKDNEYSKTFLRLKGVREIFEFLGYVEFYDENEQKYFHKSSYADLKPRLNDIEELVEILNCIGPCRIYTKHRAFLLTSDCSREEFLNMLLPRPFFQTATHSNSSIHELRNLPGREKKTTYAGYVLIYAHVNDLVCYQRVFNSVQPISAIMDSLQEVICKEWNVQCCKISLRAEEDGESLDADRKISEIGLLPAAYLYATVDLEYVN